MTDTNVFKLESWLGLSEQFFRFDKWNPCRRIER